ncbi:MAG: PAS domain S-box protein [Acidobacteria bacterium]|nr:PAS domain S-box protein [Acidobacteriota bacterium]
MPADSRPIPTSELSLLERALFREALDAILLMDDDARFIDANPAGCELFGYEREELVRLSAWDVLPPEGQDEGRQAWSDLIARGQHSGEYKLRRKDGAIRIVECRAVAHIVPGVHLSVLRDITSRKQAERALHKNERRVRKILGRGWEGILLSDADRTIRYASPSIERISGRTPAQIVGRPIGEQLHPDDRETHERLFEELLAMPHVPVTFEFRIRHEDGTWRWLEAERTNLLHDPDVRAIVSNFRDITARKVAEQTLRQQAQVLEQVSESIISTDMDGIIRTWNKGAERLLGYTAEEAIGRHTSFLYAAEDQHVPQRDVIQPLKDKGTHEAEVWAQCKSGERRRFHLSLTLLRDDGGAPTGMVGYAFDVTDRFQTELALRESERQLRELTGRLQSLREEERRRIAREIHDDLGQSLTALKMNLAWLSGRMRTWANEQVARRIQDMSTLIDATLGSVRRIASELRPGILDELGLNAAIDWQVKEVERLTDLKTEFWSSVDDADLDLRECSTPLFRICQEALTNVVRHAKATRVGVSLTDDPDGHLVLEIRDDGVGMSAGRSDSLGLVSMKERAIGCGGRLEILTEPGQGTLVRARIPVRAPTHSDAV